MSINLKVLETFNSLFLIKKLSDGRLQVMTKNGVRGQIYDDVEKLEADIPLYVGHLY